MLPIYIVLAGVQFACPCENTWEAAERAELRRAAAVNSLVWAVAAAMRKEDHPSAVAAVTRIGVLCGPEGVEFLVEHLTYNPHAGEPEPAYRVNERCYKRCPCVLALIRVGSPAYRPLMAAVEREDDPLRLRYTALIMKGTLGAAHAEAYVQSHMANVKDEDAKRRVQAVLKYIRTPHAQ